MVSTNEILEKEFGANILVKGSHLFDNKKQVIKISPALDLGLGGGIPESSLLILAGPEKCGKTVLALYIAAQCQKDKAKNRKCYYYNIEGRLNAKTLAGIPDLDLNRFEIIESNKEKILTGEEFLDIAFKLISLEPNSIHIIDSFSNLCLAAEFSAKMSDNLQMAASAKLLARFCRKISTVLSIQNSIVIGINHMISNPGVFYGSPTTEGSGRALKYQADNKLICKKFEFWKYPPTSDNVIGLISTYDIVHSSLGFPNKKITSYIRFGEGIDRIYELLVIASDLGIILQKGAGWLTLPCDGVVITETEKKIQGLENGRIFLKENPKYEEYIQNKINEMMGIKNDS